MVTFKLGLEWKLPAGRKPTKGSESGQPAGEAGLEGV